MRWAGGAVHTSWGRGEERARRTEETASSKKDSWPGEVEGGSAPEESHRETAWEAVVEAGPAKVA
jgi:hypothetical protein